MAEFGFVNIGKKAKEINIAEPLEPYSGVRLIAGTDENGDQLVYIGGSEDGRVLEVENPFGTQAMANAIFNSVRGYQYQPLYADGALLNPAAEIGDAVSVNGVYSGIYTRSTTFGTLMASDISAPTNTEVVHEFSIQTPTERKFRRLNYDMQSQFKLTNREIEAKVSKTSPQGQSAFGWNLQNDQWTVFNQDGNILRATASGLEVTGKIQADEGYIGGENGFVIKASAIYNGITELNGQGERGVYLGTDGFKLGRGFKADSSGNVTASSLNITGGTISIGDNFYVDAEGNLTANNGYFRGHVSAGDIGWGGDDGFFDGGGLLGGSVDGGGGGAISEGTIDTSNLNWGVNTSIANGESAYEAISNNGYIVVYDIDFRNRPCHWGRVRMADGSTGYAICQGS